MQIRLDPILLAANRGLPAQELRDIERIIYQRQLFLLEKYHEYHGAEFIP
jgi:hypothetical protein